MDIFRCSRHLGLYGFVERVVHYPGAQQAVALLERAGIAYEGVEIAAVALRYHHVHPPAAFLAGAAYQIYVLRGGHHYWESAYVLAEPLIFLSPALECLAAPAGQAQRHFLGGVAAQIEAFGHGIVLAAAHEHGVGHSRETLAEAQIEYGVEQIAFAHSVVAQKAVYLGREIERGLCDILEVGE